MSEAAFADVTEQVLSLSYDQTLVLMAKMVESLKTKKMESDLAEIEEAASRSHLNTMWKELKDDAW